VTELNILVIDDEEKLRSLLKRLIALEGYKVYDTGTLTVATQLLKTHTIDVVLCDVKLQDGNGVEFTKFIKQHYPAIEVILLTAFGNIPDSVQAIKNGAFDYIVKGNDNDKIIPLLSRVSEKIKLTKKIDNLEQQLEQQFSFANIIGSSPALKNAIHLAEKVAPTATAVLLTGETGTGKEIFAQAIHRNSPRKNGTFVALNCSTLNKELLESELFGHKAGAFTGANKDKKGLVEEARQGTLFLDEIGELSLELQPKLLRLLENETYIRVGDTKEMKADTRIVCATNRNLATEVAAGHFRSDLYYRIAVFQIELPALRDRPEDIIALSKHFVSVYAAKTNKNIDGLDKAAIHALQDYDWKGNVRELKNIMERAVIMEDGPQITLQSLPFELQHCNNHGNEHAGMSLAWIEQQHIGKVLKHTGWNKTEAARILGIGLATLYRKIEEYSLKP